MNKIKSIAELKQAIQAEIADPYWLRHTMQIINQFEASIKEQIEIIHLSAPYRRPMLEELEKILGKEEAPQ